MSLQKGNVYVGTWNREDMYAFEIYSVSNNQPDDIDTVNKKNTANKRPTINAPVSFVL